jgi:hypothetical protein
MLSENLMTSAAIIKKMSGNKDDSLDVSNDAKDKKKELSDNFTFSDKSHTELLEGNYFNGISEPIVLLDISYKANQDEFKPNNNITAVWISGGQPKNVNENYNVNLDRVRLTLYRLCIFFIVAIAVLIVLGKI